MRKQEKQGQRVGTGKALLVPFLSPSPPPLPPLLSVFPPPSTSLSLPHSSEVFGFKAQRFSGHWHKQGGLRILGQTLLSLTGVRPEAGEGVQGQLRCPRTLLPGAPVSHPMTQVLQPGLQACCVALSCWPVPSESPFALCP